ncbi:MAG: hypothetical protein OXD49_18235, partial [Candidatus Poribacteria bacterium]|nr:hypothetical protein [Candidatus Poribacteria bacterium]
MIKVVGTLRRAVAQGTEHFLKGKYMVQEAQQALYDFQPQHEFFVGIDSDGCVFNSMEVKHNDCFSVNLV